MEKNKEKIENRPEQKNTEVIDFLETEEVYMPTADKNGNTSWGRVTHLIRHDPEDMMYEVKTQSGRSVKVVESKSLLVWNGEEFKHKLTSDIKIGEYLPVTMKLGSPSKIYDYVDMEKYFPKNEYIYGTEYNNAKKEIDIVMNIGLQGKKAGKTAKENFNRTTAPKGWWKKNNGLLFTLPYVKKEFFLTSFTTTNYLENDYIYPYRANKKTSSKLNKKFELNNENGIFIGLFLAEGSASVGGDVQITNNDPVIRDFVAKWFDKYGIKYSETITKTTKENGNVWTTSTIRGYSTLLSDFLHSSLGHMSYGKYIPEFAYNAPDEFIIGLLNGYFSGDGSVSTSNIIATSTSLKMLEGISHLCSRFGIFGRLNEVKIDADKIYFKSKRQSFTYIINGQWSRIFAEKIPIIEKNKQEKLNIILEKNKKTEHINYKTHNDIVMDPVVSIELLDSSNYPKVYDVTIPSTDNFQIFNGLICKNTSETGYIQRRLNITGHKSSLTNQYNC